MTSITLSISEQFKNQLKHFLWVNWSEVARGEAIKKLVLENYLKTGKVSDEDWDFCEKNDWHPVDELPLKEELKRELAKRKKEKFLRIKSVDDLFK